MAASYPPHSIRGSIWAGIASSNALSTGEKSLFVNPNFTSHIVELSRQEGRHLPEDLPVISGEDDMRLLVDGDVDAQRAAGLDMPVTGTNVNTMRSRLCKPVGPTFVEQQPSPDAAR